MAGPKRSRDNVIASLGTPLLLGRDAFDRRQWATAFTHLSTADRVEPLAPDDLERAALSAYLAGHEQESESVWTRAYHALAAQGDVDRAARCAFWQGMTLFDRGQSAPGSGWIAKARRLLDDHQRDCVERGYLLLPDAIASVMAGDLQTAAVIFEQAAAIGDRFGDDDLRALARQGRGRALTMLGRIREGVSLFDEAMVAVTAHEVSPIAVGVVYCSVIDACYDIYDLKRAQEWTEALGRWCDAQPELISYRGRCLIRRSEILQVHGIWTDALTEAMRACERISHGRNQLLIGLAFYQLAELRRLRGDFADAETAYREARRRGKSPEPGRTLLRLAEGQLDAAVAAITRARDEAPDRKSRARVLTACVEVLVAAGDASGARQAADELSTIAAEVGAPLIRAHARQATGTVLLAESNPLAALAPLREAASLWRELDVPYEIARASVLIGLACRSVGDYDNAALEFDAARRIFEDLGAKPDLVRLSALMTSANDSAAHPTQPSLTAREVEVLGLVATGRTNRAIAQHLRISEKTVARHLSNIFTKLGVSTRSAATAYAYRHRLNQVHRTVRST